MIPEVCEEYAKILNENVKSLEGKTIKAKIKISKKKFLPEKQPKGSPLPSWYVIRLFVFELAVEV